MKKFLIVIILLFSLNASADITVCTGANPYKNLDVGTTDATVTATQGYLCGYYLFNAAATTRYFKLYNATIANVTVGTTVPTITIPVPAGAGANLSIPQGFLFTTAISIACTTGLADNNSGAPTANDCIANVFTKN